jgi:hypothetical protein
MGELAEILKNNLRELAQSDARRLRKVDAALKASRAIDDPSYSENKNTKQKALKEGEAIKALNQVEEVKVLLSSGDFITQKRDALLSLCRKNKIRRYSKLNKEGLVALLEENGVKPPKQKPPEKRTQKELADLMGKIEKIFGL